MGAGAVSGEVAEAGASSDAAVGEDAELAGLVEPQQYVAKGKEQLLWSAHSSAQPARAEVLSGCVRSDLFLAGLDTQVVSEPGFRSALQRALVAQLPGKEASRVKLLRVLAVSGAGAESESARLKVEIAMEAAAGSPLIELDRIEARLILLGSGGRAASRFEAALGAELGASGFAAEVPGSWHARFGAPQQLNPKLWAAALARHEAADDAAGRQLRGGA